MILKFSSSMQRLAMLGVLSLLILPGCGSRIGVSSSGSSGFGLTDRQTGDVVNLGDNVSIPDSFPSDIPRYPHATKTQIALKDTSQNSYNTSQNTNDDVATVAQWLETFYQPTDFKKTTNISDATVVLVDYENATTRIHFQIARDVQKAYTNILMVRVDKTKTTN